MRFFTSWLQFFLGLLSARVQKETSARNQKETDLEGVFSEDFRPDVEGWFWRMCNGPEVAQGVMDEGD